MFFVTAVRTVLGKYATFSGRARRSEYWWWALAQGLVIGIPYVIALVIVGVASADPDTVEPPPAFLALSGVVLLLALALFLPSLAVTVRRLHDTGRTGWWYLISLVPFGGIVLLVFSVLDSTPGDNAWGQNPKGVGGAAYGYGGAPPYGSPYA